MYLSKSELKMIAVARDKFVMARFLFMYGKDSEDQKKTSFYVMV